VRTNPCIYDLGVTVTLATGAIQPCDDFACGERLAGYIGIQIFRPGRQNPRYRVLDRLKILYAL
jgi:hypothetical protein